MTTSSAALAVMTLAFACLLAGCEGAADGSEEGASTGGGAGAMGGQQGAGAMEGAPQGGGTCSPHSGSTSVYSVVVAGYGKVWGTPAAGSGSGGAAFGGGTAGASGCTWNTEPSYSGSVRVRCQGLAQVSATENAGVVEASYADGSTVRFAGNEILSDASPLAVDVSASRTSSSPYSALSTSTRLVARDEAGTLVWLDAESPALSELDEIFGATVESVEGCTTSREASCGGTREVTLFDHIVSTDPVVRIEGNTPTLVRTLGRTYEVTWNDGAVHLVGGVPCPDTEYPTFRGSFLAMLKSE